MKMVDESLQSTSRSRKTVERVVVWTRSGDERKQVDRSLELLDNKSLLLEV